MKATGWPMKRAGWRHGEGSHWTGVQRLALLCLSLLLVAVAPARAQEYDLIFRGGRVLDGAGNPWFRADVGVRDGVIAAVGDLSGATAARERDIRGLYLAPGFIDTHSHAGGGLATEGLSHARPLLAQGITTVFVNPDGGGSVDLAAQRRAILEHGTGVNVAQFVPHGSVRRAVLGTEDRLATPAEMEEMRALVQAGMEEGAWGLSAGPFYVPGSYSDTDEQVELARVAARYGGAYQSHVRDEADYTVGLLSSVEEVITVGREAGLPAVHTHIKALGPNVWGFSQVLVHRIEQARAQGVEVYADQYPYPAGATSLSAALLPRWAQAGGADSLAARLGREPDRTRIRDDVTENLARRGGADRIQFRNVPWDDSLEGLRLSDAAERMGVSHVEAAMELLGRGSVRIVSFAMHERDVRALMTQPWTMTASDGDLVPWGEGVPHPRSYGAFPRKIREYVVEEEVVSLEAAIRSMTSLPARVFRMADRGLVQPGMAADLVVFDLRRFTDRATFTDPHQLSEGVVHLLVNGTPAILDGTFLDARAGQVLRRR